MTDQHRASPLLEVHRRDGARMVDFAGWDMPLQFTGIIAEHLAVRGDVGVFDVSHLGKLRVADEHATAALQQAMTADIEALRPGRATYSLVLADDGGCIDDVFVYRLAENEFLVVPNAANNDAVADTVRDRGVEVVDEWARWAILAVQGPRSFELFEQALPYSRAPSLELHEFCPIDIAGATGLVARTGYTGERGFELYAPAEVAEHAWSRFRELGAVPAGLGARDTLRLEMGYALYGHELRRDINPLEAGLGWVLAWDTPFRGRDALRQVRERKPSRRLVGVRCTGRGVPRAGYRVYRDDVEIGILTSGNYSPTLRTGIGLALAGVPAPAEGEIVSVEARGRRLEAGIVKPPFVGKRSSKGTK